MTRHVTDDPKISFDDSNESDKEKNIIKHHEVGCSRKCKDLCVKLF